MAYQICLQVPQKLLIKLEEVEQKTGIRKEDLIIRTLVKIIAEEISP
jgi:hypothetical protein